MVSAFASQLQAIAQKSTNELDLKARRSAHAESLLFDKAVAAKQDFDSIYVICFDGFRELCQLDSRFHDFDQNLFSEQARVQDRDLMNKADNASLDSVLNHCLILLGSRILLKPAVKALEWLVRRFRVHIHNVDHLLCTILPYHETQIWANVLSIIPSEKIVNQWKFIRPYLKTTWTVPRHAVAHAAANNDGFFRALNGYVLEVCREGPGYTALMKFWSSLVVEAVSNRLTQTRSGRKEVQSQRTEDFLHKILPLLSDGFEIRGSLDLITTCYTITIVLAARAELEDRIIDSLMLAVAQTLNHADYDSQAVLITIAILTSHKETKAIPRKVVSILAELEVLPVIIRRINSEFAFNTFLTALIASIASQIKSKTASRLSSFLETLIYLANDLASPEFLAISLQPVVDRIARLDPSTPSDEEVASHLVSKLQSLNEHEQIASALVQAVARNGQDQSQIENLLGMTISLPEPKLLDASGDVAMDDLTPQNAVDELEVVPPEWQESSFLASTFSSIFAKLAGRFERVFSDNAELAKFLDLPLWSAAADRAMLWQTFLLRYACGNHSVPSRVKALQLLVEAVRLHIACNLQYYTPYLFVLLMEVKALRKSASEVLNLIHELYESDSQKIGTAVVDKFYAVDISKSISTISSQQMLHILGDIVLPVIEECRLDQNYIAQTINQVFGQAVSEGKKGHKQALFTLLSQHAIATPLIKVQLGVVTMLKAVEKVGSKSVSKTLMPILQRWSSLSDEEANELAGESGLSIPIVDASFVPLADSMGIEFLQEISNISASTDRPYRASLMAAFLEHTQLTWSTKTMDRQLTMTDLLFGACYNEDEVVASGAQEVLKSVDLSSECLASLMYIAQTGSNEVKGPSGKRKRRSSHGSQSNEGGSHKTANTVISKINLTLELVQGNSPETKPELAGSVFDMLACLKQLQKSRVSSPYMMNVCLNCVHSTLQAAKLTGKALDTTSVKPELVTDILRSTDNPQVQNSALQLLASLSTIVPDRMVHNVMPIFTFIGHNMLSNEDDYSVSVVNEAIDKIVPALLENLRTSKNAQKYQTSVISMLASFTSSFEHIPAHRRVAFYQKLLESVNIDNFGFIMLALLANQQAAEPFFDKFVQDVLNPFIPQTLLRLYQQLLETSLDAFSSSPKIAAAIFDIQKSTTRSQLQHYAVSTLRTAAVVIKTPGLSKKVHRATRDNSNVASQLQQALQVTLASLQSSNSFEQEFATIIKQNIDVLLQLPALADILAILQSLLDVMDSELRPQALRILALQFQSTRGSTESVREKALQILQKLNGYLIDSPDDALFQASLVCIDCIAEVCGRKNSDAIMATAEVMLHDVGFSPESVSAKRLNAMLLTTASLLEVLKETSVPLIPEIMRQTLPLFNTVKSDESGYTTFRASSTLLLAVFSHAAFMVSEDDLLQLFGMSVTAAAQFGNGKDLSDYQALLETIAQKVELEVILNIALTLSQSEGGEKCCREVLNLTNKAINRSPKSEIIRYADKISQLFVAFLDIESRLLHHSDNNALIEKISQQLSTTTISFIYKVNDTTLRPIFESWTEWATTNDSASPELEPARQVALYNLLTPFFDTLKGIVISYAAYLLQSLSRVMQSALSDYKSQDSIQKMLVEKALTLLKTVATHDQDAFFGAPSHFEPIAPYLVKLLRLASNKAARRLVFDTVIPTIVSLAVATMDSPQTHATLSHHVVQLKSAESAQVRLASIKTLLALTEDEELGDEFTSNTIGIGVGEGEGARGGGSSVGEIMVYVNEMLEDDDEEVEHAVRSWVQLVRSKVGEDVFEV